jgi:transposase InsO family protein
MDDKAEKVALFRYGLIAPLMLETLPRGELTRRAQQIAARLYDIPHSTRRQVSVDTLLDWTLRYRRNGLPALSPKPRQDRGQARAVASDTAALIERLKRENPHRTGAALLRELATGAHQAGLSASTLYRFLRARGLTERQLLLDKATAHKKYEAQFANQIWQSDMLFGPWVSRPGGGKQQVFLQAALDDASRLIPHAQFYSNQGLDAFLDCLRQAIAARGIPTRLYMDNAKIYRSPQLARIAASIGILIVHTPPYQPDGRGKIERFFRSVREQFLASLDPKVLLSIEQLNERLWHWLDTDYHRREHSSLQTTPLLRWQRDIEQVRQLPPATDLRRLFFHRVDRLVRRDSTFLLKNRFRSALASGRQAHRGALRSARTHPTGDLLRRQARGPGAAGGRSRQRTATALGNGGEVTMWESFFGFKKTPFSDSPDVKQLFASQAWNQVKTRLEFLTQHRGVGLITGEVGAGKSTAARVFTATLNTSLYKILYVHFSSGSALDLLRQIALELDLEPAHFRGDLVRQIAGAVVRLNQGKKQHPILICDEAHLLPTSRPGTTPAAVELRHGFGALPHSIAGGPAATEAHAVVADARSAPPARQHAISPGRTHARGTRRLPGAATQSRRRVATAV